VVGSVPFGFRTLSGFEASVGEETGAKRLGARGAREEGVDTKLDSKVGMEEMGARVEEEEVGITRREKLGIEFRLERSGERGSGGNKSGMRGFGRIYRRWFFVVGNGS
jgi:hypothetical protein